MPNKPNQYILHFNLKFCIYFQRVYLRDRPHDVPDQDKLVWWIPIVLIGQDMMNFTNTTPVCWMRKEREITLPNLPNADNFIIINPEEIGMTQAGTH